MRKIILFVEDYGHEIFIKALIIRLANENNIAISIIPRSVRGGHGRVISELKAYLKTIEYEKEGLPDLIIVATDANCKRYAERKKDIEEILPKYQNIIICAIPEPHIERWLLLDSSAFKTVFGKGCDAPDQKCDRDRYKRLLLEAMRTTGINPPLGGMEYAEDIVNALDLDRIYGLDESLNKFIKELRSKIKLWRTN